MDVPRSKTSGKPWVFAVVAISYFLISNLDTFDLPEHLWVAQSIISLLVSFVGGFLLLFSIIPLTLVVVRLVRREHPGRIVIWSLFAGILFVADSALARRVFVDFSQERIIRRAQPLIAAIGQYRTDCDTYPEDLESLVPQFIEKLPRSGPRGKDGFRYESLDSTYRFSFNLWVSGRTYRSIVYIPTEAFVAPEYASSDFNDTGIENWKYFRY